MHRPIFRSARRLFVVASALLTAGLWLGTSQPAHAVTYSIGGTVYKYSVGAANVLQGAQITAMNLDPSQTGASAQSGLDGTFTLNNLNPGTYALQFFYFPNPQDQNAPTDLVSPSPAPITITNANSTGNAIVFEQARNTITGTVYQADGSTPLASASVKIFSTSGGAFYSVTTNASGAFTQKVGTGQFMVKPEAEGGTANWVYQGSPVPVAFSDNSGTTQTFTFTTATVNVTITGTLKMPDGTAATQDKAFAMLSAAGAGYEQGISPDASGNFSVKVAPNATYTLNIFPNFNYPQVTAPRLDPIKVTSVDANTTKAQGTINLINKTDTVTVTVKDSNNMAISNVQVMGFQTAESGVSEGKRMFFGGSFARGTTNSNGQATLYVTPGNWSLRAMPQFGGGFSTSYAPSAPQSVTVTAGVAATASVTMKIANATITGQVVDANGGTLNSVYGFVSVGASTGGEFFGGLGGPLQNGQFTLKVPAGTYPVNVYLSPGSGYSVSGSATVTVAANETATLSGSSAIRLVANSATLSGNLRDGSGATVTSKAAQIFAQDDKGNFAFTTVANGSYALKVAPGNWKINFTMDPSTGYVAEKGLTYSVTAAANQTTTQHLTMKAADSTISGTTKNGAGTAITGAYITVDSRGASVKKSGESLGLQLGNSTVSDASGNWTLRVPAGSYEVRASVPLSQGLINPQPQKVTASASTPVTGVNLVFGTANATVSGTASIVTATASTTIPLTYITAFSDKGGYSETQASAAGAYTLNVTNDDVWHLYAIRQDGSAIYKSVETIVTLDAATTAATKDLSLRQSATTLPDDASVTCSATQTCTLALKDGTTVVAPSSSLATSGNVTITATPKATLPTMKGDQPIGDYGYDFTATNDSGASIASFNSPVTVTMPYTAAALTAAGVTASDLSPKSWDTASATWQSPSGTTVDSTNKLVSVSTTHFTNFAITATAASVPTVTVTSPSDGAAQTTGAVTVAGTVSDPAATVAITVGSTDQGSVTVDGTTGAFSKAITLTAASNTVTVTATNVVGSGTKTIALTLSTPTVTMTSPTTGTKTANKTAVIAGTVSDPAATVAITVGSTDQGSVTVDGTTGAFSKTVVLAGGSNTVTVTATNAAGAGTAATLTVENISPTITKILPRSFKLATAGPTVKLTLTGTYFASDAKVTLGKTKATKVTVRNATTIIATFRTKGMRPGKYAVTVTNKDGGKGISSVTVTVYGAKPYFYRLSPTTIKAKQSGTATVTLIGANFSVGTKVYINDKDEVAKVTVVTPRKITISLQVAKLKAGKFISLVIVTPDGQRATLTKAVKGK